MSIHPDTRKILTSRSGHFSDEIYESIETILHLIDNFSVISDASFLLEKNNKQIQKIKLPSTHASWLPIRNLARILAYIGEQSYLGKVEEISIESMFCGCDYFEGVISIMVGNENISGAYKWKWTAFPGRERSYKQFTVFPSVEIVNTIETFE